MPINAVQFGKLFATAGKNVQNLEQGVAKNFNINFAKGELQPVVKNDVLAQKLEYFA